MNARYDEAKRRIRKTLAKLVAEFEQNVRDVNWWNANRRRPNMAPLDCEGDRCAARLASQCLALVDADEPIPEALWNRLMEQVYENAEQ